MAVGRPKVPALLGMANAAILIPALIVLTSIHGPKGAAWALVAVTAGFLPFTYGIAARWLGLGIGDIRQIFLRPALATALMYLAVASLLEFLGPTEQPFVLAARLGLAVAAGVCSYAASVLALWAMAGRPEGAESFAIGWLRERFAIAVMGRRG